VKVKLELKNSSIEKVTEIEEDYSET
jgi:hypothetical protein